MLHFYCQHSNHRNKRQTVSRHIINHCSVWRLNGCSRMVICSEADCALLRQGLNIMIVNIIYMTGKTMTHQDWKAQQPQSNNDRHREHSLADSSWHFWVTDLWFITSHTHKMSSSSLGWDSTLLYCSSYSCHVFVGQYGCISWCSKKWRPKQKATLTWFLHQGQQTVCFWLAGRRQLKLYYLFTHIKHLHSQMGNLLHRVYQMELVA